MNGKEPVGMMLMNGTIMVVKKMTGVPHAAHLWKTNSFVAICAKSQYAPIVPVGTLEEFAKGPLDKGQNGMKRDPTNHGPVEGLFPSRQS